MRIISSLDARACRLRSFRLSAVVGAIVLLAGSFAAGYALNPFGESGDPDAGEILRLIQSQQVSPPVGRLAYPQDGLSLASGEPLEIRVEGELVGSPAVLLRLDSANRYFVAPPLAATGETLFHTAVLLPHVEQGEAETWVVMLLDFSNTPLAERPTLATDSPLVSSEAATFSLPKSARLLDARRVAVIGERSPAPTATSTPGAPAIGPRGPDSPGVERKTDNQFEDYTPALSPDGTGLVYASLRDNVWNLYLLDLTALNEVQLTSGGNAWNPAFSPDGRSILFSMKNGPTHSLFRFDLQGKTLSQITTDEANDYYPRERADGTIVFFSDREGGATSIFTIDPKTNEIRRMTDAAGSDYWPAWSPDGSSIVFDSNRSGNQDLYLLATETGQLTQLTSEPGRDAVGSFSPDGRWLAFESDRSGTHQIYVMDMAEATEVRQIFRLTDFPFGAYVASFSADGKMLVFQAQTENGFEIFTMPFPLR
jgi:dipeptidyl aminopeptidase/acylaminoacyl peptidase